MSDRYLKYIDLRDWDPDLAPPHIFAEPDYTRRLGKEAELAMRYGQATNTPLLDGETAERLERRADALLARAAEMRAEVERFGNDDFPVGSVIIFDKVFHQYKGKPIRPSKPYHYAAMKGADDLWNTTGPRSPKGYTWNELVKFMSSGVDEVYYVTAMERFV